jgi:hypothetical protein
VRRATFPIAASRSNPKDGRNTTQRAPPAFQAKQSPVRHPGPEIRMVSAERKATFSFRLEIAFVAYRCDVGVKNNFIKIG